MARIRIALPEQFDFSTELAVRIGDINYGQHMGNDSLLCLLQEARLRFLAQYGFSETDAGGSGLIMSDAAVVYRSQARYGDDLVIEVGVGETARTGFDLLYRVTQAGSGLEVARAKTGMVFFDYERDRIAGMPDAFRKALGDQADSP